MTGVGYPDPVRVLEVQARPRLAGSSPTAAVYHLPDVRASLQTAPNLVGQGTGWLVLDECTRSRLRLPLSSGGLKGGPTALGERQGCEVPAWVFEEK
jgi:hypothetical protein